MPRKKKKKLPTDPLPPKLAQFWGAMDWSLQNVEIAEAMGYTGERIRQIRKLIGAPASPHHARHREHAHDSLVLIQWFRRYLHLSGKISAYEMARRCPLSPDSPTPRLYRTAQLTGFIFLRQPTSLMRTQFVNWDIPTSVLARIWKLTPQTVSHGRARLCPIPRARWFPRRTKHPEAYLQAVELEKKKADEYFRNKNRGEGWASPIIFSAPQAECNRSP